MYANEQCWCRKIKTNCLWLSLFLQELCEENLKTMIKIPQDHLTKQNEWQHGIHVHSLTEKMILKVYSLLTKNECMIKFKTQGN